MPLIELVVGVFLRGVVGTGGVAIGWAIFLSVTIAASVAQLSGAVTSGTDLGVFSSVTRFESVGKMTAGSGSAIDSSPTTASKLEVGTPASIKAAEDVETDSASTLAVVGIVEVSEGTTRWSLRYVTSTGSMTGMGVRSEVLSWFTASDVR